jgi:hypothetical protein
VTRIGVEDTPVKATSASPAATAPAEQLHRKACDGTMYVDVPDQKSNGQGFKNTS